MASLPDPDPVQEKQPAPAQTGSSLEDASQSADFDKEAQENYMSGFRLYILIFGLGLAVFLMALDMTILVVAIPLITEKFQSTADIGWYMYVTVFYKLHMDCGDFLYQGVSSVKVADSIDRSGYLLTLCAFQPLSGKIYSNFSLKVRIRLQYIHVRF
jgi:hypothetical protein